MRAARLPGLLRANGEPGEQSVAPLGAPNRVIRLTFAAPATCARIVEVAVWAVKQGGPGLTAPGENLPDPQQTLKVREPARPITQNMTTLNSLNPVSLSGGFGTGDASTSSGTAEKSSPGLFGRMTGWLRRNPAKNDPPQTDEAERSAEALLELADGMAARDLTSSEAPSDIPDSV